MLTSKCEFGEPRNKHIAIHGGYGCTYPIASSNINWLGFNCVYSS